MSKWRIWEIVLRHDRELLNYSYDFRNQMTAASYTPTGGSTTKTVTQSFDAFGNRIERDATVGGVSSVEKFVVDGWDTAKPRAVGTENFDVAIDLDGAGNVTNRRMFGAGFDDLLGGQDGTGAVRWYGTDHIGSVRTVFDNSGLVTNTVDYDAFGSFLGGVPVDRYAYTGREYDSVTGLTHYRAREKDGHRFLSEDPKGFSAGDANLARYVGNGPTSGRDPSGMLDPGPRTLPGTNTLPRTQTQGMNGGNPVAPRTTITPSPNLPYDPNGFSATPNKLMPTEWELEWLKKNENFKYDITPDGKVGQNGTEDSKLLRLRNLNVLLLKIMKRFVAVGASCEDVQWFAAKYSTFSLNGREAWLSAANAELEKAEQRKRDAEESNKNQDNPDTTNKPNSGTGKQPPNNKNVTVAPGGDFPDDKPNSLSKNGALRSTAISIHSLAHFIKIINQTIAIVQVKLLEC